MHDSCDCGDEKKKKKGGVIMIVNI